MRGILILFLPMMALMIGCQGQPKSALADTPTCDSLKLLLDQVTAARTAFEEEKPWAECAALLTPALAHLRVNMLDDTSACNFLNMKMYPDVDRLLFVDLLRERTESDTIAQGVYFLLHLRGIFDSDPDIAEFFEEELAHVAHNNPTCFMNYIHANPDQEVMLLYSTKWNRLDINAVIQKYSLIDTVGTVVAHLAEQKLKWESGS